MFIIISTVNLDGGSTLSPSDGVGNNETTEVTTVPGDEQALTEEEHLSYKYGELWHSMFLV